MSDSSVSPIPPFIPRPNPFREDGREELPKKKPALPKMDSDLTRRIEVHNKAEVARKRAVKRLVTSQLKKELEAARGLETREAEKQIHEIRLRYGIKPHPRFQEIKSPLGTGTTFGEHSSDQTDEELGIFKLRKKKPSETDSSSMAAE